MINIKKLNPNLIKAQYAVRGKIVQRAYELEQEGKKIIYCNIGNPQALKQKPLTYVRQLLALCEYPKLIEDQKTKALFHKDVIEKVQRILAENPNGLGAYTQSEGMIFIRKAVSRFISERDGIESDPTKIILTDGASKGIQSVFTLLLNNPNSGFMIPIPQYPLYSATIELYGAKQINYYLDEEKHWELNKEELESSIEEAKKRGIEPVAIVVINPGNPTGSVLSKENIKMIISFAQKHNIAILADEVYQENIYSDHHKFYSFAKVMDEMKVTDVSLFSFHSTSKGFLGECGHRGGYFETRNVDSEVYSQLVKLQSIGLCSNTAGQIVTYAMVNPPQKQEESYETYMKEKNSILGELKKKAEILGEELNKIKGMSLKFPYGAMYAFVKIDLPEAKNIKNMSKKEMAEYESKRDFNYCLELLEETGICVVPGSGFGQKPHTYHFRTTFLPPADEIKELVKKLKKFHENYLKNLSKN
ncbi:MAG TPA: aminotransferase class I/II-fold pyridoxal phosphate-dependent enzyme [Elusimicrobiales bacterium]|nr:aminotransferase class I/II-fold pyridoxal phosphate-dependent enzyme [Elusimicrobiales bacterium]HPO94669.1 aminotransferase class I/II-fold pyridoxal phosphate-dependent enzyme [Elusimicrobiales bacterium]